MMGVLHALRDRRAALVARSARARRGVAAALGGIERSLAEPVVLGLGVAVALLGSSPRLRGWFVRAWVAGAFLRRLLGR
jgi:hypothetical protein